MQELKSKRSRVELITPVSHYGILGSVYHKSPNAMRMGFFGEEIS